MPATLSESELPDLLTPLTPDEAEKLDTQILESHANDDATQLALAYRTGGQDAALRGDIDAACFLYTQAYVFALRAGLLEVANGLWSNLKSYDREA